MPIQRSEGHAAQAAEIDDEFPLTFSLETPAPVIAEDSLVYSFRPPLTGRDVLLQGLGGLGMGILGAAAGALVFGTLAVAGGLFGWGVAILAIFGGFLGYALGVPLGVWLVGNNEYRWGNFWVTLGMSMAGALVGALIAIIPFLGIFSIFMPIIGGILGFWLSSRWREVEMPQEEYYYEEDYYDYLQPGEQLPSPLPFPMKWFQKRLRKQRKK